MSALAEIRAICAIDRVMPTPEDTELATNRGRQLVAKVKHGSTNKTRSLQFQRVAKPCTIEGVAYHSMTAAARALNMSEGTIKGRCQSANYPNWRAQGIAKLAKRRGQPGKQVSVDGILFDKMRDAATAFGISTTTVRDRIESRSAKWECWQWA